MFVFRTLLQPVKMLNGFIPVVQMDQATQSFASSDPEDCDAMQECPEDRKYPGEVTTSGFKVKFQPKDSKKELLS